LKDSNALHDSYLRGNKKLNRVQLSDFSKIWGDIIGLINYTIAIKGAYQPLQI